MIHKPPTSPKVFLSYSHDSPEHLDRVLALSDRLRADGVNAWIDQYETSPPEGWPRWCAAQIRAADFIIMVCTEVYKNRFHGTEESSSGLGVRWEGYAVIQELYSAGARNTKFVPVCFAPAGPEQVPLELAGSAIYDVSCDVGYRKLYRYLTNQPEILAPGIGKFIPMPPRERRTVLFERFTVPEPLYENRRIRPLAEALDHAYQQLEELTTIGAETKSVRNRILRLRRAIRAGGRFRPGDLLAEGRFKLLERLGEGGFGTVWRVYDRKRHEVVALKVLHNILSRDHIQRERFFRGARMMSKLHHEGIVRVIEEELKDRESGLDFFVMEYIDGGDLHKAIINRQLEYEAILPIVLAVGESVAYAHDHGVVHRDIKPANILLDNSKPKLTDFDLVQALDTTGGTRTHAMLGTFLFAAPETLQDAKAATATSDIYSLAMTAVFAFYGRDLPVDILRTPELVLGALPCPSGVQYALRRAIAWDPAQRPSSIKNFCTELQEGSEIRRIERRSTAALRVHPMDEMELVFVPGGEYVVGAGDISDEEKPVHHVHLSAFWVGKYPVTNEQYGRFLQANPNFRQPEYWDDEWFNQPRQPVVGVSWEDAQKYCTWAGLQLLSEAQWEVAARGKERRTYPWGDDDPTPDHANFNNQELRTTLVDAHPLGEGPFGTFDQAGNVWEWCEDVWNERAYEERDGSLDPVCTTGDPKSRCLRGGSWFVVAPPLLTSAYRFSMRASKRFRFIGFRCALRATLTN